MTVMENVERFLLVFESLPTRRTQNSKTQNTQHTQAEHTHTLALYLSLVFPCLPPFGGSYTTPGGQRGQVPLKGAPVPRQAVWEQKNTQTHGHTHTNTHRHLEINAQTNTKIPYAHAMPS